MIKKNKSTYTTALGVVLGLLGGQVSYAQTVTSPEKNQALETVLSLMNLTTVESQILSTQKRLVEQPKNARLYATLGSLYLQNRDYLKAESAFQQARALRLSERQWAEPLANIYLKRHKYLSVIEEISDPGDLLAEDDWAINILVLRADAYRALERFSKAERLYQKALDANPYHARAHFGLAKTYFLEGKPTAAISAQIAAAKQNHYSDDGEFSELIALTALKSGEYQDLEKKLQRQYSAGKTVDPELLMTVTHLSLFEGAVDDFFYHAKRLYEIIPSHPRARYLYALSRYQIENVDEAEQVLAEAISANPTNVLPYVLLAKIYYEHDNIALAASVLSQLQQLAPENPEVNLFLSVAYLELDQPQKALPLLEVALKNNPGDYRLYGLIGNTYLKQEDWESALAYYQKAAQHLSKNDIEQRPLVVDFKPQTHGVAAYLNINSTVALDNDLIRLDAIRAIHAAQNFEMEKAKDYAAQNLLLGQDALSDYLYGKILAQMGQHEAAEPYFLRAYQESSQTAVFAKALVKTRLALKDFENAQPIVSNHLVGKTKDSDWQLLQAEITAQAGEVERTIDWLSAAIESAPEQPEPRAALLGYYLKIEAFDKALAFAKESYERFPDEIQFLSTFAKLALQEGSFSEAEQAYQKLIEQLPGSPMMLSALAKAQYGLDKQDDTLATLERLLEHNPEDIAALSLKAQIALDKNNWETAQEIAEAILELRPSYSSALVLMAQAKEAQQHWREATLLYDQAYQAAPSATLLLERVRMRDATGSVEEGVQLLKQWVAEYPEDLSMQRVLAQRYHDNRYTYEAVRAYERILLEVPDDMEALLALSDLYSEYDVRRALDFAQRAHHLAPETPKVMDSYGWALLGSGAHQKGFQLLEKAAEKAPDDPFIRYHLGVAKHKLGDVNGAKHDLSYVIRQNVVPSVSKQAVALLKSLDKDEHFDAGIRL